jgi:hypothetical protein
MIGPPAGRLDQNGSRTDGWKPTGASVPATRVARRIITDA